jgi:hypothetical protein
MKSPAEAIFFTLTPKIKDVVNKWGQSVGKACNSYEFRNQNIFRPI